MRDDLPNAGLLGAAKLAEHGALDGKVEIGIVKDDEESVDV